MGWEATLLLPEINIFNLSAFAISVDYTCKPLNIILGTEILTTFANCKQNHKTILLKGAVSNIKLYDPLL